MQVISVIVSKNNKYLDRFDFVGNPEFSSFKAVMSLNDKYNIITFPEAIEKLFKSYKEMFNSNLNLLIIFLLNIDRQTSDGDVYEITCNVFE